MSQVRTQPFTLLVLGCLAPNCGHIGIEPQERIVIGSGGGGGTDPSSGGARPNGGSTPSGGAPSESGGGTAAGGKSQTGGASTLSGGSEGVSGGMGGLGGELGLGGAPSPRDPCSEGDFGPLELITGLAVDRDKWAPSVTADGLLLLFAGSDATSETIYQATRPSRDEAFGPAIRLMNLEHTSHQGTPFINADGRRLYYAIEGDEGPSGRDLWFAERDQRDQQFGTRNPITALNSSSRDHLPWLTFDEKTIYFTTSRNTQSWLSEIWTATRTSVDTLVFSGLTVVNTERIDSEDGSPTLTPDGLTMYFTSDRNGEFDVWSVRRTSLTAPFQGARREAQLSEQGEEINIHLSPDGREMFLSSTGDTRQELFISKRDCPD